MLAWLIAAVGSLSLAFFGFGEDMERQLSDYRAALLQKDASSKIAVIEIDAKSIAALDQWPWPREYYATLTEKLTAAHVAQIAFDVDFSSKSTAEQDALFASALRKAGGSVILPTFKQLETTVSGEYVESMPLPILRKEAFLASVNVHPNERGQLNSYSFGTVIENTVRPSLASMLAGAAGTMGESFKIDQSIDPATIPRFSFVNVLKSDKIDPALAGKRVLIGATAIELGDRYPMSRHGVMPAVLIQALAADTLIQGTNLTDLGMVLPLPFVVICLIGWLHKTKGKRRNSLFAAITISMSIFAAITLSEYFQLFTARIAPAVLFVVFFTTVERFSRTTLALQRSRLFDETSALPNQSALGKLIGARNLDYIAVARIADFHELLVVADRESRKILFQNLSERLKFLAVDGRIFHLDTNTFGWAIKDDYLDNIADHFETAAALFHSPFPAADRNIKLTATFGVSIDSIDKAKVAAKQAIAKGRRWAWHDEDADEMIGQKQNMLAEIEQAIADGEISVVYQPKWDLAKDQLDGAEALVRWSHPERGNISPELFIPILEKAHRIDDLTIYVLKSALQALSVWQTRQIGLSCSINISAILLSDGSFIKKAIEIVEQAEVGNDQVIFEVTETATLADLDLSILALNQIRNAGIKVSVDDYGTGQSTMSYLQRLPIDELKIDQSFIKTMMTDESNRLLVRSTIDLAQSLNLKVVAEGIEDQDCMDMLTKLGCDIAQGWQISKPVSSDVFEKAWLGLKLSENAKIAVGK